MTIILDCVSVCLCVCVCLHIISKDSKTSWHSPMDLKLKIPQLGEFLGGLADVDTTGGEGLNPGPRTCA